MSARIDRKSIAQANAEALDRRTRTYADESSASWSYTQDRVRYRPATKSQMLRWAQRQARFDGPGRLHGRDIADDGAPKMTGETRSYLGMTGDDELPTDWVHVACRLDENGDYITPMRAAIARIGTRRPHTARLLARLVVEFCDEQDAVAPYCHSEFTADIIMSALDRLYDAYTPHPIRTKPREVLAS